MRYAVGRGTLIGAPEINHETLRAKGFTPEVLERLERALPAAFDIKYAFNHYTLGETFCRETLGISDAQLADLELRPARPRSASRAPSTRRRTSSAAAP